MTDISQLRERMMNRLPHNQGGWYSIQNADGTNGDTAEVRIYDFIDPYGAPWGKSAQDLVAELDAITAPKILVAINSRGGDVFDGIAIYNALRLHAAHVTTRVDGIAASIASVIVQAGDVRQMVTGSQMMVHNAWAFGLGNAAELRDLADLLDKQDANIASIYADRSGADAAKFADLMAAETWLSASETVDAGLADATVKPVPQADPQPQDRPRNKFTEQASTVIAAVEELVARAEEVIAFRTEQGKTPLSDDSVELVDRLRAAIDRITAVADDPEPTASHDGDLEGEFLRFVATTLQGV